jgi:hypothetical protein
MRLSTPRRRSARRSSPSIGFEKLGAATDTSPKSLIRMFGRRSNPQAKNLFSVIGYLQKQAGLQLHVTVGPVKAIVSDSGGRHWWRMNRS